MQPVRKSTHTTDQKVRTKLSFFLLFAFPELVHWHLEENNRRTCQPFVSEAEGITYRNQFVPELLLRLVNFWPVQNDCYLRDRFLCE